MNMAALLTALAVFASPAPSMIDQEIADLSRLHSEIAGDYEFYANQRYLVLKIYIEQEKFWGREEGSPTPWELRPVDQDGLKFKVEDPVKEQYAFFDRDENGRISRIRLVTGGKETVGSRIPDGGRTPHPAGHLYSAEDLRSDLAQIRRALEENHPAIYGFVGRVAFERLYEERLGLIDGPKTLEEFFVIAAPLVSSIGCGHTSLSTPRDYWTAAPPRFFPLAMMFVGGRAYLVRGADAAGGLQPGSEILSINGRVVSNILKDLKVLRSSDGANDGWKTAVINATFARDYAVRFGYPQEFVIEALPPGQKKAHEVRLRPVELSKVPAESTETKPPASSGDPNLDFKIIPAVSSTAVLTIRDFGYYNAREKFKSFVDESFDRIRRAGIRNLILDLRDNSGGDPFCTTHLFSYLEPRPVPYFARTYRTYEQFAEPVPRAAAAFEGKLYVLVDGGCFSSTGHFCALLKFHNIGTFIGTETGGTYECNDASLRVDLEKTRLRLSVARMTFTAAVRGLPRYRGIVPDIMVEAVIADVLAGKDPVLERALSLIAAAK